MTQDEAAVQDKPQCCLASGGLYQGYQPYIPIFHVLSGMLLRLTKFNIAYN